MTDTSIETITQESLTREVSSLLSVALPMAVGAILEALVPFLNILMLARLGPQTVAAAALVATLFGTLLMIFWGVFSSASPLIARRYGERNHLAISDLVVSSCWLALSVGSVVGVLLWRADILLVYLGQPVATIDLARGYFHGLAFAASADFLTFALFNFFQGIMQSKVTMWLSLLYVPINIVCNYVLMFGVWGLPKLGAAGIGYGTAISFWLLLGLCVIFILSRRDLRSYFQGRRWPSWPAIAALLRLGLPLGLLWSFTLIFFFVLAVLMGKMSDGALAAYQLVRQWIDFFFIIAYCFARALSIKISEAIGQGKRYRMAIIAKAALLLNTGFMVLVVILLTTCGDALLAVDLGIKPSSDNYWVIHYAHDFFKLAAIYIFLDTARTLFFGALLGLQDITYLLAVGAICWLVVGVPVAILATHLMPHCPNNLWLVGMLTEALGLILLARRYVALSRLGSAALA